MSPAARFSRYLPLLLLLAVGWVYSGELRTAFVFDDLDYVTADPRVRSLHTLPELLASVTRPVVYLTISLNYATNGLNEWDYKATNLLIHLGAALALYGVVLLTLRGLGQRLVPEPYAPYVAFAAAALWGVHPLTTSAVTYVWQRCESLTCLLYLLTLYCYIRGARPGAGAAWKVMSVCCCALGMGCKEVMVTAPLAVLFYDRAFLSGSFREAFRRRWGVLLGLAATWAILTLLLATCASHYHENRGVGFNSNVVTPFWYLVTESVAICKYLSLAVWPRTLVFDYYWPFAKSLSEAAWPGALTVLLFAAVFYGLWRNRAWSYPGVWFFLVLAPTSSFMPMPDPVVEYRMYSSLAALVCVFAVLAYRAAARLERPGCRRLAWFALLTVPCFAALSARTVVANSVYVTETNLWRDTAEKMPHSTRAHTNYGCGLLKEGDLAGAEKELTLALKLNPGNSSACMDLGAIYAQYGNVVLAKQYFERALRLYPKEANARVALAQTYIYSGELAQAETLLGCLLAASPYDTGGWKAYGRLRYEEGKLEAAADCFRKALEIDPDDEEAKLWLEYLVAR